MGYSELDQINRLKLYYVLTKHWLTSVRKCRKGTSWQDVLKAEKCIDMFTVMEVKSDWLDLPLRMQVTSCRYLLILGIKLIVQRFYANLAISNYFAIPLRVRDSGVLLYSTWLPKAKHIVYYLLVLVWHCFAVSTVPALGFRSQSPFLVGLSIWTILGMAAMSSTTLMKPHCLLFSSFL